MEENIRYARIITIDPLDNVATAVEDVKAGEEVRFGEKGTFLTVVENIPFGHKVALAHIAQGCEVIKYGEPIGSALTDIKPGQHVHVHNMIGNRGRGDLQGEGRKSI